jgi:hypothetical protein
MRTHFSDVNAVRLRLKQVTVNLNAGPRRGCSPKREAGPEFRTRPKLDSMRLPSPRIANPNQAQSAYYLTAVRYHHCRIAHPQVGRRQISPVMNHLRNDHRNRNHRANDENEVMRRPDYCSSADSHRILPERCLKNATHHHKTRYRKTWTVRTGQRLE